MVSPCGVFYDALFLLPVVSPCGVFYDALFPHCSLLALFLLHDFLLSSQQLKLLLAGSFFLCFLSPCSFFHDGGFFPDCFFHVGSFFHDGGFFHVVLHNCFFPDFLLLSHHDFLLLSPQDLFLSIVG